MHRLFVWLGIALLSVAAAHVVAQDVPIYTDGLLNGFANYSYGGGSDFNNPAPFHSGAPSIAFTGNNTFNAVSFAHPSATYASGNYSGLRFFVHGGGTGGQHISLMLQTNSSVASTQVLANQVPLDGYIAGGAIPANSWAQVDVPFNSLAFTNDGSFDRIDIITSTGVQPVLYIDDVSLTAAGVPAVQNWIFTDSFEPEYLLVPQYTSGSIKVYQRATNTTNFSPSSIPIVSLTAGVHPNALAFAPDGALWVVDNSNTQLLSYSLQSILTSANPLPTNTYAVTSAPGKPAVGSIYDMAFFGNYGFVASDGGILRFAISDLNAGNGNAPTQFTSAYLSTPAGLAFDVQGRLWICNNGNSSVVRMSGVSTATATVDNELTDTMVGAYHAMTGSEGLGFDEYGSLWVGNNNEPTLSVYADSQLNGAVFPTSPVPVHQIVTPFGTPLNGVHPTGYAGGIAFDHHGDLRANYEYDYSVQAYTFTAVPSGGGYASYADTQLSALSIATTDPGRGGITIWPVPSTVHR